MSSFRRRRCAPIAIQHRAEVRQTARNSSWNRERSRSDHVRSGGGDHGGCHANSGCSFQLQQHRVDGAVRGHRSRRSASADALLVTVATRDHRRHPRGQVEVRPLGGGKPIPLRAARHPVESAYPTRAATRLALHGRGATHAASQCTRHHERSRWRRREVATSRAVAAGAGRWRPGRWRGLVAVRIRGHGDPGGGDPGVVTRAWSGVDAWRRRSGSHSGHATEQSGKGHDNGNGNHGGNNGGSDNPGNGNN
jgi:hypothetical protein